MHSFKHNQQDATLYNILYYVNALHAAAPIGSSKQAWHIPDAVCTDLSS